MLAPLEEVYKDDLRIVHRHFPLVSIHPNAFAAAEAAEAAGAQGAFWEMHDLLFERAPEWSGLSPDQMSDVLTSYAQELALDVDRFSQDLENRVYQAKVQDSYDTAARMGLGGTPTFIVNGYMYPSEANISLDAFIELTLLESRMYSSVPPQVIDPDRQYTAIIRTERGDIVVELYADQAPINVNSFAFLAQDSWYDGQAFFYVEPGQAAYSGDPTNLGMTLPHSGYTCDDEISTDVTFDEAGMLALYTASPNLNSSMFFITYAPQPKINGQFTIIGRVIEGMDVVESLTETQPGSDQSPPDVIETILIEEK